MSFKTFKRPKCSCGKASNTTYRKLAPEEQQGWKWSEASKKWICIDCYVVEVLKQQTDLNKKLLDIKDAKYGEGASKRFTKSLRLMERIPSDCPLDQECSACDIVTKLNATFANGHRARGMTLTARF